MRAYMDNSATSFPKPAQSVQAMVDYMTHMGTSVARSTSKASSDTGNLIFELREKLAKFFKAPSSRNVIFTKNITEALNIVIHSYIQKGDRVLISALEHNAVTRPLTQAGAEIIAIPVSAQGNLDLSFAAENIGDVKAVFCTHASNVSGDVMPIEKLISLAKAAGVPFILDTAQTAGHIPLDMTALGIDCLCFTGHKGLLGPTGTGGMILTKEFAKELKPFITGGTGSQSDDEVHPKQMPDKFEAGTPNIVGLVGLLAALEYLEEETLEKIFEAETKNGQYFYERLLSLPNVKIVGSGDYAHKPPVFSLDFIGRDNAAISYILGTKYNIDNRTGMHCAPRAHKTYGTYPQGTVRLSLSHSTTKEEMDYVIESLHEILKEEAKTSAL